MLNIVLNKYARFYCTEIAKSILSHVSHMTGAEKFPSPEPKYRGKMKKKKNFRFSIFYTFHAILNPKNEKKNFDPKF